MDLLAFVLILVFTQEKANQITGRLGSCADAFGLRWRSRILESSADTIPMNQRKEVHKQSNVTTNI